MREVGLAVASALIGYGLAIVLGVIAHESLAVGWASLACGASVLAASLASARRPATPATEVEAEAVSPAWRGSIALLGVLACVGTLAYNLARGSSLTVPEVALVVYGALLVASLPWLGRHIARRVTVMSVVAWSVPVVLAPLALYAANGVLTGRAGGEAAAASPLVRWGLVAPTAALLDLLGHDVALRGNALLLATPRGSLTLSVGLVCAGIYPAVLFGGMFALYAWDRRPPWRTAGLQAAAGLAALWALNLLRMVALAQVGVARGTATLQQVHGHIGWLLFAAFSVVFWWLVLRRKAPSPEASAATV